MSEHRATVVWRFGGGDFRKGQYSREHTWSFDGGLSIPASPSPTIVRPPYSNPASVDPEEAFIAAIASCHLLTFLYLAGKAGIEVSSYADEAVGVLTKNEAGVPWVSSVVLRPRIEYGAGSQPSAEHAAELHHQAHLQCFIANSVKTQIRVEAS